VWVSGVLELLGAAGLLWLSTRRAAGLGLFALTIAVTRSHFYMLQRPDLFSVPYWALVLRIPVQVALLALIVWSTAQPGQRARPRSFDPKSLYRTSCHHFYEKKRQEEAPIGGGVGGYLRAGRGGT